MRLSALRHALIVGVTGLSFASSTALALPPLVPQVKVAEEAPRPMPAAPTPAAPMPAGAAAITPAQSAESSTQACTDGVDNDEDGLIDCADPNCRYVFACSKAARRSREETVRAQLPPPRAVEDPSVPVTRPSDLPTTGHLELNLPPAQSVTMPRLVGDLPLVDKAGGSGRMELALGFIALPVGVILLATGIPTLISSTQRKISDGPAGAQFGTSAMMLVFGTGAAIAGSILVKNGFGKRAAYRKTEKLLQTIGALPLPNIDVRAGLYGAMSTIRF